MKLLVFFLLANQLFGAYGYYIAHDAVDAKVSNGPHTDFPVLIDTTSNDLRTTGNGGYVTNSNGYDIQPASDTACTSFLSFERESYNATTGQIRMHVKISSLATTTVVYLCFGDSGVTTDQAAPTSVWNSAYKAVYHFGDGSTLSLADSTSNANTLTNSGATADSSGQIYGAMAMSSGSSQYAYINSAIVSSTPITFTAWAKSSTTTGAQPIFTIQSSGSNLEMHRLILYQSKVQVQTQTTGTNRLAATSTNYSTSNWFHTAGIFASATSRVVYLDGGSSGSETTSITPTGLNKSQTRTENVDVYFNGSIDELRISNVARSEDWIITEYNAGIPSTFWSVGGTVSLNPVRRRLLIQ